MQLGAPDSRYLVMNWRSLMHQAVKLAAKRRQDKGAAELRAALFSDRILHGLGGNEQGAGCSLSFASALQ